MNSALAAVSYEVCVEIGGMAIAVCTTDTSFRDMLLQRYGAYVNPSAAAEFYFDIELVAPGTFARDDDVQVRVEEARWVMERGDFRAEWDPASRRGRIRQSANPYSIDSVLRIVHTLLLAASGGFLLHAASAVSNGRAFLFAGMSGAGKTTMTRLAPPDVQLLTDEISYVRPDAGGYRAFGTPFAGELARPGENISAPIAALYLLGKAAENRLETVVPAEAVRGVLQNLLFFAEEQPLVNRVLEAACAFAERIPVQRLWFAPDQRVWELIG
jgi:hypothetical protein